MRTATLLVLALAAPAAAHAAAPQPKKPVEIPRFLGRWYEVARTPNHNQKDAFACTMDWAQTEPGRYSVIQACRKGSPTGPKQEWKGSAKVVEGSGSAKMNVVFFGGLVRQEYWVLDHAPDYSWAVIGTPGGHFIWVLSRKPATAADREPTVARVKALGYDPTPLEYEAAGAGAATAH